ncbi:hypothetical protein ACW6GR_000026 [Klebsiella michiganensis]|uniref:hypothetical protein n=1 Tax=Klebsiella sp. JB_Kp032 TaxID=3153384 RepID=UPI0032B3711D
MTSSDWSVVSSIATCAAALSTTVAAIVAFYAMRSWKVQEKIKAYQKYKMSLDVLRHDLSVLPEEFTSTRSHSTYRGSDDKRPVAIRAFSKCSEAWVGYSVHRHTKEELDAWEKLRSVANAYLFYGGHRKSLNDPLEKAYSINSGKSILDKMRELEY